MDWCWGKWISSIRFRCLPIDLLWRNLRRSVRKVGDTGGSGNYSATFYGTALKDIGSGIQLVSQTDCAGNSESIILIFGSTNSSGLPTVNINGESFYNSTFSAGIDLFFAGFNGVLDSLIFGSYIGGSRDDYLGDTGDPRGANHLNVNGADVYCGTTTHSSSHTPTLASGGFDTGKSNTTDDAHILFSIQFTSLLKSDYGDAPSTYGTPSHILDCANLRIDGLLDDEMSTQNSTNADGDDANGSDDEDGVVSFPTLTTGGPQNISVQVVNVMNTTGKVANLYAWIDLDGDGNFSSSEIQSTTVANGFSGNKTLTWTGAMVSGSVDAHYLRLRLTTTNLNDNAGTSLVDERSTASAANGEVEDYRLVTLNCPVAQVEVACQTQTSINSKFATWLTSVTAGGGCNGTLSNNNSGNPSACGAAKTVTFTWTSSCAPTRTSCSSTFTVTAASQVVLNCASNITEAACQTQTDINSKYATWLATTTKSGGCNAVLTNNSTGAPLACGGSKTVTFTVTSDCEAVKTCTASFTVTTAPAVVLNCASNVTEAACQTQTDINSKYATWLATTTKSGGCNAVLTNNSTGAPLACGGSKTVIFTVTSDCEAVKTCTASFTVTTAPAVVLNCASNVTEAACQTQTDINSKYATWLATTTKSGGCNAVLTNNSTGAPLACGGSKTVTFTVTSDCEAVKTCTASFTVTTAPAVVLNCVSNVTEAACQTQTDINSKYATWLATTTKTGLCTAVLTNNSTGAPLACGGSKTVTFTVTSDCEAVKTCTASFTVTTAPAVVLNCVSNVTEAACQTQTDINSKYATWLTTVTKSGGCNAVLTNNSTGAPLACGGSKTVIFTVTSDCEAVKTCTASFTVTTAPAIVLNCASNVTEAACQTQTEINSKYATWLATTTKSGGCNAVLTNNSTGAPLACGGSKTVIFTVTSDCEAVKTCTATFSVTNPDNVVLNCPNSIVEVACQGQTMIDSKFATWLATANASGGCNGVLTNNNSGAPDHCLGGTAMVTFNYSNSCSPSQTCSSTFTVIQGVPSWTLIKSSTTIPNSYNEVGDSLTYSITLDNTGNLSISSILVSDPQADPGSIIYVSGDLNNNSILESNETWMYTASHTVTQADLDAGSIINTATSNGTPQGGTLVPAKDTAYIPAIQTITIGLVKTGTLNANVVAPNGIANPGDKINYAFKVTNTGNVTLSNVIVTDPIITVTGGPITLAPGAMDNTTFTGSYTLTQVDIDAGKKDNTATTTGEGPQNQIATNSDDETVNLPKSASIDIVKTGVWNDVNTDGNADAGETVSYTFKVTNTGNVTLTNIVVTDPLFTVTGGPISLAPGQMDNTTFTGTYTLLQSDVDAGVRLNTATVNGKDPQDITITDSDDETVNLPKSASIDIVKTGVWNDVNADGNADAGETVSYTFKVTNTGNVTLTNIVVTDPLFAVSGGPITLAPGQMDNTTFNGTYTLLQSDVDAGVRLNTATVNGKDPQDITITDSDDETVNLPKSASIDIVKTGVWNDVNADGNADAGETVSYTFKVTNTGNVTLNNIVVTDPLFAVSGGPITLAPGQMDNTTFTGTYTLLQSDVNAGVRLNTATVNGKDPQDITITDSDDETVNLPKSASIDIVKIGVWNDGNADGNADAGETVSYTFKVTNTGNVTLTNILVTDPLFAVSGGPISLAPGQMDNTTFTGTYTLLQSDVDAGVRLNTATVKGKDPQDITITDNDDETVNLPKAASIDIVKTGVWNDANMDGNADAGETVSYTFKVTNTGNVTLTNIVVTDPLFAVSGGPITLAPGQMDNTTFTGTYVLLQSDVDAGVRLNTATVNGKDPQDITITDSDDETVTLPKSASIDIVKTGVWNDVNADGNADAGETVSYTFKVTNTGNVTLTNIVVTDPLFAVSGGPITLAPGQMDNTTFTGTYTLLQSDVDAGVRLNTATVNGKDPQDITITDSDDETVNLPKSASIDIVKTGVWNDVNADGNADAGETVSYTFKVTNTGNVTLTNILVTDPLFAVSGGPFTLAPGQMDNTTFTGTYTLLQSDVDAGVRLNTATVNGKDPQDITITDNDDETVNLPKSASIDIVKTGVWNDGNADGNADAGETVSYTFKVTNTGNVSLTNIVVTDPLFAVSGGPITLAPGQMDNTTFTGTYTLLQSDVDAGVRLNSATVNGKDPQDITITDNDDETVNLPKSASIDIVKTGVWNDVNADGNADAGETVSYTFKVTNTGNVTLDQYCSNRSIVYRYRRSY
ncbi:MAG: DUF11 domain-containing protein [Saprospiraceae bacterium]|nr:DUF11 domain-containing protein [Candidatus Vicinibacter proximus]